MLTYPVFIALKQEVLPNAWKTRTILKCYKIRKKSLSLQPSTEDLTPACSSSDTALFDQLHLQHSTPCASVSSECSVKLLESREEVLGFEELSRRAVTMSQRLTEDENVVLPINPHVGRVEKEASVQGSNPLSIQNEKPIQNFIETDTTEAVGNVCQLAQAEHILKSCPFRSPIPIWETDTGYGIMEEPDLTLVSNSDISITETDLANLTLEDREDNEAQFFQAGVVLPTSSMETSVCGAVSEPYVDQPTVAPSATSGSLQEAFMTRQTLTERSYQRQREIWNKTRLPQTKVSKEKLPTGCTGS